MNIISDQNQMDIFPSTLTQDIPPFSHPVTLKNFRQIVSICDLRATICYLDKNGKINYKSIKFDTNLKDHFFEVGKTSFNKLTSLETSPWLFIEQRLKKKINAEKKNIDVRTCFVFENHYLVKRYFTFGLRTVSKNNYHIFETTTVPLALYVAKENAVPLKKRSFKATDQCHFRLYRLKEKKMYYLKENTSYIIVAVQKTLFSVYITNELPNGCKAYHSAPKWREVFDYTPPQTPVLDRINMRRHMEEFMSMPTKNVLENLQVDGNVPENLPVDDNVPENLPVDDNIPENLPVDSLNIEIPIMARYNIPCIINSFQVTPNFVEWGRSLMNQKYTEPPVPSNFKPSTGNERPLNLSTNNVDLGLDTDWNTCDHNDVSTTLETCVWQLNLDAYWNACQVHTQLVHN